MQSKLTKREIRKLRKRLRAEQQWQWDNPTKDPSEFRYEDENPLGKAVFIILVIVAYALFLAWIHDISTRPGYDDEGREIYRK
jgi:hypothetical protein